MANMAGWRDSVVFLGKPAQGDLLQDDEGNYIYPTEPAKQARREVPCNRWNIKYSEWQNARTLGLFADAQIQVHVNDYHGEAQAIFDGQTMDVERVFNTGEYITLTLGRRKAHD